MDNGTQTAMTVRQAQHPAYLPNISPEAIEQALAVGDLMQMSPQQRVNYYVASCQSIGLNPLTRPFDAMKGQDGKYRLYANAMAAEQLRKKYRVSIKVIERHHDKDNGLYSVTVQATTPDGREEESQGIVEVINLKGQALANAFMKAESKAKRRVTMSICGLGYEDAPAMAPTRFDPMTGDMGTPEPPVIDASFTDAMADPAEELFPTRDIPMMTAPPVQQSTPQKAPVQKEMLGVEHDTVLPQKTGGQKFIDELNTLMVAHGETPEAIAAYWRTAREHFQVEKDIEIPRSALPKMLTKKRKQYEDAAVQPRVVEPEIVIEAEPQDDWRTELTALLAVVKGNDALLAEMFVAADGQDTPDDVGRAVLGKARAWQVEMADMVETGA